LIDLDISSTRTQTGIIKKEKEEQKQENSREFPFNKTFQICTSTMATDDSWYGMVITGWKFETTDEEVMKLD
jgi:hypothetical protein